MRGSEYRQMLKGVAVAALMLLPVPATSVTNAPSATPELPPATAASDLSAGATAVEKRQYDLAIKHLSRAIDSGTLSEDAQALALHHRGIAQQKLGFDGLAIFDYTKALELNALPRDVTARAYYNRGLAKTQGGDLIGAELDYSHAIEFNPFYAAAYHNRANLERERHDYPTAIRDYSVALANLQGRDRALPLMGRAISHRKAGDIASASSDLDQIIAIDPTYVAATRMRRELAAIPAPPSTAFNASADALETASIAPRHGEVISKSNQGGWQTSTVRYNKLTQQVSAEHSNDDLVTGALRDIDMVPAPGSAAPVTGVATQTEQPIDPKPTQIAALTPPEPIINKATGRYKVQLGAFRAPELATQAWNQISRRNTQLVEALDHSIEEADLGARGTYFRLQAGSFETVEAAKSRCSDFVAQKIDCIVVAR
ncbi:MAG: SPOR domain-containing protein [Parvibaculum sp.]|nr:SPOR domain-containing protein [Parvibaculum sp.]